MREMSDQIPEIGVRELSSRLKTDDRLLILDVREQPEWDICHIEGALHLPMRTVELELNQVPDTARVAVLCHHGMRSAMVTRLLLSRGYDAVNVSGGIDAWSRAIDENVARY